jgi:RNA polymerase sigma-70 factor (ECF subfamily)
MEAAIQQHLVPTKADFHAAIARRADRWYSACLKITRSPDMAADAVQDALLSAWNKRSQFSSSARLETWIHSIAINSALQLLRKCKPDRLAPLETEIPDESISPHDSLADTQLESRLAVALEGLTEIERVCFVLKHFEQWRLKEIADELGTNVGVIKQALFRAVRKLRVSMADMRSESNE